mgnify:CR=1 FL=1
MDHSIYEALNSSEPISKTVEACRKLRKEKVEEFELPKIFVIISLLPNCPLSVSSITNPLIALFLYFLDKSNGISILVSTAPLIHSILLF